MCLRKTGGSSGQLETVDFEKAAISCKGRTCYDHRASLRPVKPDSRRKNQRAKRHSTQRLANTGRSCRSECIRAASKWEIPASRFCGDVWRFLLPSLQLRDRFLLKRSEAMRQRIGTTSGNPRRRPLEGGKDGYGLVEASRTLDLCVRRQDLGRRRQCLAVQRSGLACSMCRTGGSSSNDQGSCAEDQRREDGSATDRRQVLHAAPPLAETP